MPPNQRRSTGALRMAFMISVGEATVLSRPIAAAAAGVSVIDFWRAREMMPPADSFDLS